MKIKSTEDRLAIILVSILIVLTVIVAFPREVGNVMGKSRHQKQISCDKHMRGNKKFNGLQTRFRMIKHPDLEKEISDDGIAKVVKLTEIDLNKLDVIDVVSRSTENTAPIYINNTTLTDDEFNHLVKQCEVNGLDVHVILGLIDTESSFRREIVSKTADYGLMQINRVNLGWLKEGHGLDNMLNSYQNITAGTMIIGDLYERYDNYRLALMAYNYGETGAKRRWAQGIYTSKYAEKVLRAAELYK